MKFDTTLKKLFQRPPSVLLSHVLGEKIVVKRILPTSSILIENLEPDVLFETGSGQLIHVELHGYGMAKFAARNLIYCGLVIRDYDRAPIQVVFWIGPGEVGIASGLTFPNLQYRYVVIDVRQIDAELLIGSPDVGEAIFGILCKLRDVREDVMRIVNRIREEPSLIERNSLVTQLLILSGLRGLSNIVRAEVESVPLQFDIRENDFLAGIWQQASTEGEVKGEERGLERGLERGREAARDMLIAILTDKFGPPDEQIIRRIRTADQVALTSWTRRAARAGALHDVFG